MLTLFVFNQRATWVRWAGPKILPLKGPGLVVMGGDSHSDGPGSNPGNVYWMDMTFIHIDLLYEWYCLFEKTENKQKRGRGGPF